METKIFDIKLPTSWAELSDKQLLLIYDLFARDLSAAEVKTLCLMKWNSCYKREQSQTRLNLVERCKNRLKGNRLKVLCQRPDKRFLIKRKGEPGHQRKPKRWFSRKYYASVMNIRDFLAENIGSEFVGIVAKSLDDNYRRYNH